MLWWIVECLLLTAYCVQEELGPREGAKGYFPEW